MKAVYKHNVRILLTLSVGRAGSELGCSLEEGKSVNCFALRSNCLVHTNLSSPA